MNERFKQEYYNGDSWKITDKWSSVDLTDPLMIEITLNKLNTALIESHLEIKKLKQLMEVKK